MRTFRQYLILAITAATMVAAFATPALASAESQFVAKINASRAAAGKAPLEVYWDLTDDARDHSARMADKGEIYHNPGLSGVTGVWQALGENVGVGPDVASLHEAFMNSPTHRGNILGDYNYIGVGVATDEAGLVWVTMIYMRAAPGLNGGGSTTTTTVPPTTTTVPPAVPASVAPTTTTVPPAVPASVATTASSSSETSQSTAVYTQRSASPGSVAPTEASDRPLIAAYGHPYRRIAIAD
ncbi:MAG: hypothetical protein BMS9Abin20_1128 [Acidimicrobiia bacterium]|nr:MAG: hypothetical protein BMS9Abin20_1128 [Acidimicrobiia bacterium]